MNSSFRKVIEECTKEKFFRMPTLFTKQTCDGDIATLIGVTEKDIQNKKIRFRSNGITINLYIISLHKCMSLIMSKDLLLYSLFSACICLKDDLNVSRMIFQSIKPILLFNHTNQAPNLEYSWSELNNLMDNTKELIIRFNDISCDTAFISNVFIPLVSYMNSFSKEHITSLLFNLHNNFKEAYCSFLFPSIRKRNDALLNIQKFLYLRMAEVNCQNIEIPCNYPSHYIKVIDPDVFYNIANVTTEFQTIVFAKGIKDLESSSIITEIIYAYVLIAKQFFGSLRHFITFNDEIYKTLLMDSASDTLKYIVHHCSLTKLETKIGAEHRALCLKNAVGLFSNYYDLLSDWESFDCCQSEFCSFVSKLQNLRELTITRQNDMENTVRQLIYQLFHSFELSKYYQSYIPSCIKFISDEI